MKLVTRIIKESFENFRPHLDHLIDEFICALVDKHPEMREILFASTEPIEEKSLAIARYLSLLVDNCNRTEFFNGCVLSLYKHGIRGTISLAHLSAIAQTIDDLLTSRLHDELTNETYTQWKIFFGMVTRKFHTLINADKGSSLVQQPPHQGVTPQTAAIKQDSAVTPLAFIHAQAAHEARSEGDGPPVHDGDTEEQSGWGLISNEDNSPEVAEPPGAEHTAMDTPIVEPSIADTPIAQMPVVDTIEATAPNSRISSSVESALYSAASSPSEETIDGSSNHVEETAEDETFNDVEETAEDERPSAVENTFDEKSSINPISGQRPEEKGTDMHVTTPPIGTPETSPEQTTTSMRSLRSAGTTADAPMDHPHDGIMGNFSFELPQEIKRQIRERVREAVEQAVRREIEAAAQEALQMVDTAGMVAELLRKAA